MATRLKKFERKKRRYPWSQWTRGAWRAYRGKDYDVTTRQFYNALHVYAVRHGLFLQADVREQRGKEFVDFQFSKRRPAAVDLPPHEVGGEEI